MTRHKKHAELFDLKTDFSFSFYFLGKVRMPTKYEPSPYNPDKSLFGNQ